jgi:hypothetical protein
MSIFLSKKSFNYDFYRKKNPQRLALFCVKAYILLYEKFSKRKNWKEERKSKKQTKKNWKEKRKSERKKKIRSILEKIRKKTRSGLEKNEVFGCTERRNFKSPGFRGLFFRAGC